MNKYYSKEADATLFVGQVWHDDSNGEPDVTVLEIGEKLSTKGRCNNGASHEHLHSKVKAVTQTEGYDQEDYWDAENLLDFLICNCYEPVDAPAVEEAKPVVEASGWPQGNESGNCWCGHKKEVHINVHEPNGEDRCLGCQCVGYVEDKWVTK